MINYSVGEVKKNLEGLMSNFCDWDYAKDNFAMNEYSDGMSKKNMHLQKIFDGTDGRIILSSSQLENFADYLVEKELNDFIEGNGNDLSFFTRMRGMNATRDFTSSFQNNLRSFLSKLSLHTSTTKVEFKDASYPSPFNGQRITKALNSIFDFTLATNNTSEILRSSDIGIHPEKDINLRIKEFSNDVKNQIIGGTIASILTRSYEGQTLILSIRPEDFFLISYGNSWRSCMHPNGGEYNNGTLGYMAGPDAMVGFTVDTKEFEDANNKWAVPRLWRQIMFVAEGAPEESTETSTVLMTQRGYPCQSPALEHMMAQEVLKRLEWPEDLSNQTKTLNNFNIQNDCDFETYGYVDAFHWDDAIKGIYSETDFTKLSNGNLEIFLESQGQFRCLSCGKITSAGDCNGLCQGCFYGNQTACDCCGDFCDEDDLNTVIVNSSGDTETWCENCIDDGAVFAESQDSYILCDLVKYVEYKEDYFLEEDVVFSRFLGEYILFDDAVETSKGDFILEADAVYLDDGTILTTSDTCYFWSDGTLHEEQENKE